MSGSPRAGYSLVELLVSLGVVAVLLAVLLPLLVSARRAAERAVCQSNLRQVGAAFAAYAGDHGVFPVVEGRLPEWSYGGAVFVGASGRAVAASTRPLNEYVVAGVAESAEVWDRGETGGETGAGPSGDRLDARAVAARVFRCPSDRLPEEPVALPGLGAVPEDASSFFGLHGTSYLANRAVVGFGSRAEVPGAAAPGSDGLRPWEIGLSSRLILAGDPVWYPGTLVGARPDDRPVKLLSWHGEDGLGMAATADGSARALRFEGPETSRYVTDPSAVSGRGELGAPGASG